MRMAVDDGWQHLLCRVRSSFRADYSFASVLFCFGGPFVCLLFLLSLMQI